jgi:hypothetical protein
VKALLPYLWLDFGIKVRVVVSMLLLVFSKVNFSSQIATISDGIAGLRHYGAYNF